MPLLWLAFDRTGAVLGTCEAPNKQMAEALLEVLYPATVAVQSMLDWELQEEERRARARNRQHRFLDSDDDDGA